MKGVLLTLYRFRLWAWSVCRPASRDNGLRPCAKNNAQPATPTPEFTELPKHVPARNAKGLSISVIKFADHWASFYLEGTFICMPIDKAHVLQWGRKRGANTDDPLRLLELYLVINYLHYEPTHITVKATPS